MKKIATLITVFLYTSVFSQKVEMNENVKMYEYEKVVKFEGQIESKKNNFIKNLKYLNYKKIDDKSDFINAESFITKMLSGSAMEVHYNLIIKFREDKYKLIINSFKIKDVRYGTVAVETLRKGSQKRWVKFINENIENIVSNIEKKGNW